MESIAALIGAIVGGLIAALIFSIVLKKWMHGYIKSAVLLFACTSLLRLLVWVVLDSMRPDSTPKIEIFIGYLLGALIIAHVKYPKQVPIQNEETSPQQAILKKTHWHKIKEYMTKSEADYSPSKYEIMGFRALLLTWGIGAVALLISACSYYMYESTWASIRYMSGEQVKCEERQRSTLPACQRNDYSSLRDCQINVGLGCNNRQINWAELEQRVWDDRQEMTFHLALLLLSLPTFLFYSIRWIALGRLRPVWFLKLIK
jgi:hypothetical protein